MLIIPAIDIRGGKAVRLIKGDYKKEKFYPKSPVEYALEWERGGGDMLHIVDLDGAAAGTLINTDILEEIVKNVSIPVEFGGGIRNFESAEKLLGAIGVERIIMGTKAFDSDIILKLIGKYGSERIVAGVDAKDGIVKTNGWLKESGVRVADLIDKLVRLGVKHIIYTDISRDGMLSGPNVSAVEYIAGTFNVKVVVSGGVSSIGDIRKIVELRNENIYGVIIGKALYEGKISVGDAVAVRNNVKE